MSEKKLTVSNDMLTNKSKLEFLDAAFTAAGDAMDGLNDFLDADTDDVDKAMDFRSVKFTISVDNDPERAQLTVTLVRDGVEEVSVIHELVQKKS